MFKNTNAQTALSALTKALLLWLPIVLVSPSTAFGYTDPGTGAFVYQAAYAVFLGGTYYLRKFLDRVFRKRAQK
jgi:hypothetical protein